jgi:hypothetical protein
MARCILLGARSTLWSGFIYTDPFTLQMVRLISSRDRYNFIDLKPLVQHSGYPIISTMLMIFERQVYRFVSLRFGFFIAEIS